MKAYRDWAMEPLNPPATADILAEGEVIAAECRTQVFIKPPIS